MLLLKELLLQIQNLYRYYTSTAIDAACESGLIG